MDANSLKRALSALISAIENTRTADGDVFTADQCSDPEAVMSGLESAGYTVEMVLDASIQTGNEIERHGGEGYVASYANGYIRFKKCADWCMFDPVIIPVSVNYGWHGGINSGHETADLALRYDLPKIRRRIEDKMRKNCYKYECMLLETALSWGVSLD